MQRFASIIALYLLTLLPAQAATITLLTPTVRPGDAFIASFSEAPTSVSLQGKQLHAFPYRDEWRVVVPVPLSATSGAQTLTVRFKDATVTKTVAVTGRTPLVINLPVPPKLNQTPQQLVTNLAATNSTVGAAIQKVTPVTRFTSSFALPLRNNRKISSPFGEVRQTGNERITHMGVDFDQPKGSAVAAINDGVVSRAYADPVYGNSVHVDHGRGIYSLYLHLEAMKVREGQTVKKGTLIGTLGESGLASAPHLHLSIKINGTSVDPLQFVNSFR